MQIPIQTIKDSSALMQVDQTETSIVLRDETQNGGFAHAETIIYYSKVVKIIFQGCITYWFIAFVNEINKFFGLWFLLRYDLDKYAKFSIFFFHISWSLSPQ